MTAHIRRILAAICPCGAHRPQTHQHTTTAQPGTANPQATARELAWHNRRAA